MNHEITAFETIRCTELAANRFRANQAHRQVGANVRQTIQELGGTRPENLPAAESIKKPVSKTKQALKTPKP